MQGRRLGNWLKQRQNETLDYTEPEAVETEAPAAQWQDDPDLLRSQRRRRLRWILATALALFIVVTGAYLLIRSATAYQRLVQHTFEKNIAYIEYQPFANAAFIKVDDPSLFAPIRDWFAEAEPQDQYTRFAAPTCQLRVVYADGTSKLLVIDSTGPSVGPDDMIIPPVTGVPIWVDGHKRWASAHAFHMAIYSKLPKERQLATSALPVSTAIPGGVITTVMGTSETSSVSPYDAAMENARQLVEHESHGQALLALKEALRWMPDSIEAQELAAVARTQLRFQSPRLREQVAAIIDESDAPFANRATYHQVRSDLLEVAWMFPPEDPEVRRLRQRLAARRPRADAAKFREFRRLSGEPSDLHAIRTLLWSPDATRIVAPCSDTFIRIWDATSGRLLYRIPAQPSVESLAFSADGRYLLAGKDDLTDISRAQRVWDLLTCEPVTVETDHPAATTQFIQPDGLVATSNEFGDLQLREARTKQILHTLAAHAGPIRVARFSPDGDALLTFADDKTAILWSDAPTDGPAPLEDNRYRSMRRLATLPGPGIFAPDGTIIVIPRHIDAPEAPDNTPPSLPLTTIDLKDPPREMRLSPDGKLLFATTESGDAIAIDIEKRTERHRFKPPTPGGDVAFAPEGKHVAYGHPDGSVRVIETASGNEAHVLKTTARAQNWATIRYSNDGRLLLARDGAACAVWEVANGANWFHTDGLASADAGALPAALSPDGKRFAVSRHGNVFEIIATDTFDATVRVQRLNVTTFSFSPDTFLLAAADAQGTITIHDATSGAALQTITPARTLGDATTAPPTTIPAVRSMLFSPDANTLLVDPTDGSPRLIDVTTATELRRLPWPDTLGHPHPLSFSPDSTRLLTGPILWGSPE